MIFVTVGNATQSFDRLLNAVNALASKGFFGKQEVIIQSGHILDFHATHCTQKDFLTPEEYKQLISESELVICHGGAGVLSHAFQAGKIPVVMPRRSKYGEHVDDQFELVKMIAAQGRIISAYEPQDLPDAITEGLRRRHGQVPPPPSLMLSLVANAIEEIRQRKQRK